MKNGINENPASCQNAVRASTGGLNVISLFNGMNTCRQALENQGFKVNKYYSSEIKPYAIELTQHHFPDTIQVGDINNWREWDIDWKTIDFIGSGSPCQDLSVAGKRAGIKGKKSSLFFVFIEILEHVKSLNPNVIFFQENVGSAPIKDVGIMSRLYKKPTQIIQPYQFGHTERKSTCLWLAGLPKLEPTEIVEPDIIIHKSGRTDSRLHYETFKLPKEERRKARSKTFSGIAKAMSEQWGSYACR